MKKQMYHLSECIEPEGTLWVIEKESPNSGVVVFETKNKNEVFAVLNNLNTKNCDCDIKDCKAFDMNFDKNCSINNFTFGISFCRKYMFKTEGKQEERDNKRTGIEK